MLSKSGSSYLLSRQWFDFALENPELINVNQTALYVWLIDLNNRRGWAVKFNFNTNDACDCIGVKNRKTVWAALNKLVEFGFVSMIYKANAPGKASVISIVNNRVSSNGCLDKSLIIQSDKRTGKETVKEQLRDRSRPGSGTMDGHSIKQGNRKQINNKTFVPPTLNEVITYCNEKGHGAELAKQIFEYYEAGDWHDSNDAPVLRWKQKFLRWFKESDQKSSVHIISIPMKETATDRRNKLLMQQQNGS